MKSKIAGVALAAVMACGLRGVQRAEASLLGDTIHLAYFYPDLSTEYTAATFTPQNPTVNFGVLSAVSAEPIQITLDYSATALTETLSFTVEGTGFMAVDAAFNGLVLTDLTAPDFDSVFLAKGIRADHVTSTGDQLRLDLQGATYLPGAVFSVTFGAGPTPPPVPLPAAAPLFGAALLALGGIGFASRRGKLKAA